MDRRSQDVEEFFPHRQAGPPFQRSIRRGGAGTFSDGKLNTGTKDPRSRKVLEEFVKAGAPEEILSRPSPTSEPTV